MVKSRLTFFGALKRGYQSGSYNTATPATGPDNDGDEEAQGGELGMKSLWLDDHLALNLSTYDYHLGGRDGRQ